MTTLPSVLATAMTLATADPFAGLAPLDQAELADHRGGMMINGIPMDFAVVVRTTVEGAVARGLQTLLTVNERGGLASATTTPIGDTSGATLTATEAGGMALRLPTGTRIIHDVQSGHIKSLIANTQSDVTLNHRTDINVDLPGIYQLSQTWYGNSRSAQMGIDAALSGLGRR